MAVPALRFKADDGNEYPEWEEKRLGDVAKVIDGDRGKNYPKEKDFFKREYCLFLNAGNVTKDGLKLENTLFITQEKDAALRNGKLLRGDLVITTRGTIGNICYYDDQVPFDNIRINSGMLIIRPSGISAKFLYYSMKSALFHQQIELITSGNAQPQLTKANVIKLTISLPTLAEQQKIGSFFAALDQLISLQDKKVASLKELKKGLMQKIFSRQIRFKADDGSEYPEWEEKKLEEVCFINPNRGGIPELFYYIDLESVNNGVYNKNEPIKADSAPSRAQRLLKNGDIIYQMVRPYQKNNYIFIDKENLPTVASTGYAVLEAKNQNVFSFIYYLVMTDEFNKQVLLRCTGGAYPAINSQDLKTVKLSVPCRKEQQKIASFLSSTDNLIQVAEKKLAQLKEIKKGLIQKMFV